MPTRVSSIRKQHEHNLQLREATDILATVYTRTASSHRDLPLAFRLPPGSKKTISMPQGQKKKRPERKKNSDKSNKKKGGKKEKIEKKKNR